MPPRKENSYLSRAVEKSNFLISAGNRLLSVYFTLCAGWIRVVLVLTGSFLSWTLYRGPRRYLSSRLSALTKAFRRFSVWPGGAGRVRAGVLLVGGCLWLLLEWSFAVGDRFLVRTAEKLDQWGGPVRTALRRALSRAGAPVRRAFRLAGRLGSGRAARLCQGLDRRWRASRPASWPAVYQLLAVACALAVVLVPYELVWGKNALAVTVGGKVIGQVAGSDEVWLALQQLEEDNRRLYGRPVVPLDAVDLVRIRGGSPVMAGDELRLALARYLRFGVPAGGISVNGQVEIVLRDPATAQKTLRDFAARYGAGRQTVRFAEAVTVVPVTVPPRDVVSESEALALLGSPVVKPATYTVRDGDTIWQLAKTFHTSVDTLEADNPGLDINHLGVGDVLNLDRVYQTVNVLTTYRAIIDEAVPYPVQWRKDAGLGYGQTELVQPGRPGREEVVAVVTEENGDEVSRQVLQRRVLQAPVPEIERTGGDVELASRGASRLLWPAPGPITSGFGWRTIFGGREFHEGIDIGAAYGTPIVSAAAGVVTSTGWISGYGLTVTVDHGNGLSTLYAHMSRILVKEGERVARGQELGQVGETGRHTGPHLDFEVHVNGVQVNPLNFF